MKSDIRKKVLVILLCMVMVISGTNFGFADGVGEEPAEQTTTSTEKLEITGDAGQPQSTETEAADMAGEQTKDGESGEAGEGEPTESAVPETPGTENGEDSQPSGGPDAQVPDDASGTEIPGTEIAADGETVEGTEASEEGGTENAGAEEGDTEENTHGVLPEEPSGVTKLEYEDDQIKVTVEAETTGIIPEGAALKVVPILAESEETREQYREVEEKLLEKAEEETYNIAGFLAYDISFINDKEEKLEPNGEVKVSMEYKQAAIPEEVKNAETDAKDMGVTVMHLEEDEQGEVKEVVDLSHVPQAQEEQGIQADGAAGVNKIETLDTTEGQEVQKTEFLTESFSAFTITWVMMLEVESNITFEYVDESGNSIPGHPGLSEEEKQELEEAISGEYVIQLDEWVKKPIEGYTFEKYILKLSDRDVQITSTVTFGIPNVQFQNFTDNTIVLGKNGAIVQIVYKKGESSGSNPKETVPTIDSASKGVKLFMKNYKYNAGDIHAVLGGGYKEGSTSRGLVKQQLGEDGFPVATGNQSLKRWFDDSVDGNNFMSATEANHLFRADRYNEDGTFYYSSLANFAYLNGNEFILYQGLATPMRFEGDKVNNQKMVDIYAKGNFFPYNNVFGSGVPLVNAGMKNWFGPDGERLGSDEELKDLYVAENAKYHFSMYLETDFIQAKNGVSNGSDMIYSFTGDDDLWVFIDDKLVLDMGGVHDAAYGSINFKTGEVIYGEKAGDTTESFANIFGAEELNSKGTFENYSKHTLKMFYMERNGGNWSGQPDSTNPPGASILRISFNLPVVEPGTVQVKKELVETDKDKYGDIDFGFKMYLEDKNGDVEKDGQTYSRISWNEKWTDPDTNEEISIYLKDSDSRPEIDGKDPAIFYLKPEQTAVVSGLAEGRSYFVEEVNLDTDRYKDVFINNVGYKNHETESDWINGGAATITAAPSTVQSRPLVAFGNSCSEKNRNELRITKELAGGTNEVFSVKVWLENQNGELAPCNGDAYYLQDSNNNYYYYTESGQLEKSSDESGGSPARVCGTVEEGMIQIPAGYTASITQILAGVRFAVEETGPLDEEIYNAPVLSGKHKEKATSVETDFGQGPVTGISQRLTGEIQLNCNAIVTVKNSFKTPNETYTWELVKKSRTDTAGQNPLAGAKFTLTNSEVTTGYYGKSNTRGIVEWYSSDPDINSNAQKIAQIPAGVYTLVEVTAPVGYQKSAVTGTVTIGEDGITIVPSSHDDSVIKLEKTEKDENANVTTYKYAFYNEVVYSLPGTGRGGLYWYLISGILLMMTSGLILYIQKSKYAGRC